MVRPARVPPPSVSMISRSGVPIVNSPTPARATHPLTVHSTVPGDSSVPTSRNQSAPSANATVTWASVSALSTSVGGASVSAYAPAISTCAESPESDVRSAGVSTISSTPRR